MLEASPLSRSNHREKSQRKEEQKKTYLKKIIFITRDGCLGESEIRPLIRGLKRGLVKKAVGITYLITYLTYIMRLDKDSSVVFSSVARGVQWAICTPQAEVALY